MALSDRTARLVLGGLGAGLVIGALATDLARRSGGEFWGDGATYVAMARSLAEDFDLRYEARDVLRVRREFASGPQGVFLKRASGGLRVDGAGGFPWISRVPEDEPRLYFAKGFVYPLVAAPFVRLFGTRGLVLVNVLVFVLALWLGYEERRRRGNDPLRSLVLVLVVFLATVAPLYLLWPTPEMFGLGLVTAALAATSVGRPWLAAALFGVAVYLKPPNLFLALPLGVIPLLPGEGERLFGPGLWGRVVESVKRGLVVGATALALYGLNAVFTGEMNYQGGERKTFYGRFPLEEHDVTFDNSGFWMTTDHLGPLVEGEDEDKQTAKTGPLRASEEIRSSFLRNLGYFWVGRFGGVLPYFAPAFGAVVAFLVLGPRGRRGWLAFASLAVSWLFYLWLIPDNWYGGGGTVGNRYFLSLLPLALFLVPRGRVWPVAAFGLVVGAPFVAPLLAAPLEHSLRPGRHATSGFYRFLPAELTMLNDLSVFTEPWRKKRPFGFTGDPQGGRPADADAYFLYFMDDGTHGKEAMGPREGFRLRGGARAEIVLRAFDILAVKRVLLRMTAGSSGDEVEARLADSSAVASLVEGQTAEISLEAGRG
ncbi:MAG TPA: hypothetical protein VIC87_09695, partial [Vicinamibacteria bacterium]